MSGAYERGCAAALRAAADSIKGLGTTYISTPYAADHILSLPIVGDATNPDEPVAWRYRYRDGGDWRHVQHRVDANSMPGYEVEPLYAHPARPGPSQECVMVPHWFEELLKDWERTDRHIDSQYAAMQVRAMLAEQEE